MKNLEDYNGQFMPDLRLSDFSPDALAGMAGLYSKLYIALDGFWYLTVKGRAGNEEALASDIQIWDKLSKYEMFNITEQMNIRGNDVSALMKAVQLVPWLQRMQYNIELKNPNHAILTVTACPTLNALEKETQGSLVPENHPALGESITATEVKLNLALPELDENTAKLCDGIGILKAERLLTSEGRNPFAMAKSNPEELVQLISSKIGGLAKLLYPKPLCYRSLDLSTDEARDLKGEDETPREPNPLLGWKGMRRSLDQPWVFRCEIEALKNLNQEGLNNIILLLPFISTLQEFKAVKSLIGFPMKLGIVIDTPSSALSIGDFCREGIIHASINLGNLAQLTLGVDRENPEISRLYSETDPAVLRLVRHVVSECKKRNIEVSVFSDANLSSELIEKLIGLGIRSISVDKAFLEGIKADIAKTEKKLLLEKLRSP